LERGAAMYNINGITSSNGWVYALRSDGAIFSLSPVEGAPWDRLSDVPGVKTDDLGFDVALERAPTTVTIRDVAPLPPLLDALPDAAETIAKLFRIPNDERFRLFDRFRLLPPRDELRSLTLGNEADERELARRALVVASERGLLADLALAIDDELTRSR
jgi:hypothetical protein